METACRMVGLQQPIPTRVFENFLEEAKLPVSYVLNCTVMHDPFKDSTHIGFSPNIMRGVFVENQGFWKRHFKALKHLVLPKRVGTKRVGRLVIALFCKSGKHRSVAATRILAHVLQASSIATETEHVCTWWWKFTPCQRETCRTHRPCEECFGDASQELRRHVLSLALELWESC